MAGWPILSLTTFLPLVGAAFVFLIRGEEAVVVRNARNVALWTTLVTFVLSLFIWVDFDPAVAGFQMVEERAWIPALNITFRMGVDGISVLFVLLSTFLMPLCILASWTSITKHVKEYMIAFLVLETMMVGMFCAIDFVVFYLFFEGVLLPMYLIIGVWGGPRRVYAAFKFFLYTLLGSVLMLVVVLTVYSTVGSTSFDALLAYQFPREMQLWMWLCLLAAFAVKVPMWPVHTWLPDAHVEAPTAGSVILAGVLLKMGGYGFLRFSIPMLPLATDYFTPLVFGLSVVAVIYTSLVALAQEDMKKLIAYASVAHMGFVTIGMFSLTTQGVEGAIFLMVSHGIVSASLFLCVGVLYDRLHTREIARYGGLVHTMPVYAVVFMVIALGLVGLPGTSGFVGEFLVLLGTFQVSTTVAALAATGVILSAAYALYLYRRVMFGKLVKDDLKRLPDLDVREMLVFAPLLVLIFWMGIYPSSFLSLTTASVASLIESYNTALAQADSVMVAVR